MAKNKNSIFFGKKSSPVCRNVPLKNIKLISIPSHGIHVFSSINQMENKFKQL